MAESAQSLNQDKLEDYLKYLATFAKGYHSVEELERRAKIFFSNDKFIREWNSRSNGAQLGHNRFSDWDDQEYA